MANLFLNHSFEGSWYDIGNSQVPTSWHLEWYTYPTYANNIDTAAHSRFRLGESRVLSRELLPPDEWDDFIAHGNNVVKVFAGSKSIWFSLTQAIPALTVGDYELSYTLNPDLVDDYTSAGKIFAPNATSGQVRFVVGINKTPWVSPVPFGQKQRLTHTFNVSHHRTNIPIGIECLSPHPLAGNNWFLDNFYLVKLETNNTMTFTIPPHVTHVNLEIER